MNEARKHPRLSGCDYSQNGAYFVTVCTRKAGQSLWQTSFYDHIIRDERDCVAHLRYMEENPAKWLEDPYYKS